MQIPTRSRGPVPDHGAGAATSVRPQGHADRLATLRASQAGLDAETRLRRLLLALVVPELVVALVLLLVGSYVGVVLTVLAAAVQLGAALLLVPGAEAAAPGSVPPAADRAVIVGQGEEIAALRAQLETAEAGLALQNELARRHRELLLRQLARIDALEADEADPAALGELFALDHLATRMRRYSEGALLIAGSSGSGPADAAPVPASEVLRGAVAEIEDFHRVDVSVDRDVMLAGGAAVDLVHLLAELIENAAVFSAPGTRVKVHGVAGPIGSPGYVVKITDEGVGLSPERTADLHALLTADSPGLTPGRLGYQLVARLARRQGLVIDVATGPGTGTAVGVAVPPSLVVGSLPTLTIPEAGEGLAAHPAPPAPVPALEPEPVAADTDGRAAYVPDPPDLALGTATPEAAVADGAQAASVAEAGFTDVSRAPEADWEGLPLPVEHLGDVVLPYDLGDVAGSEPEPGFDEPVPTDDNVVTADFAAHAGALGADPVGPDDLPAYDPSYDAAVEPAHPGYDPAVDPADPGYDPAVEPGPAGAWPPPPPPPVPVPVAADRFEPALPAPVAAPAVLVPAQGPAGDDGSLTGAGLARRTPQAHMAPQMAGELDTGPDDDALAVPAPDRSRSLLSAYRDGLVLGRGGLTPDDVRHHIDDRQQFDVPYDETEETP